MDAVKRVCNGADDRRLPCQDRDRCAHYVKGTKESLYTMLTPRNGRCRMYQRTLGSLVDECLADPDVRGAYEAQQEQTA